MSYFVDNFEYLYVSFSELITSVEVERELIFLQSITRM